MNKKNYKILKILTKLSKNLYNHTLYIVRQHYELNNSFLPYELAYHEVKNNENYQLLPSQVAQQTMKVVNRTFKSFFGLLREHKRGNYNRPVKIPKYLPKDSHFLCIFMKDMMKIEGDKIRLSRGLNFAKEYKVRYLYFTIPKHIRGKKIKEVRILSRCNGMYFEIEYIYLKGLEKSELKKDSYFSIDLGLDNFATCISTDGTSFIIEGKGIKSFNRWWNKEKAKLQSVYDKQKIKKGIKLCCLFRKRKNVLNDYMNKTVHYIVQYCLENKVGNVIIGRLKNIKQNINIGRKNNQNFVSIPYNLFKQKLKSKCEVYGIEYIETSESYTSQECSNCGIIDKTNRKYRGLYVCKNCGNVINADVNGAINILKKVAPDALLGSSGTVDVPNRIRTLDVKCSKHLVSISQTLCV